MKEKNEQNNIEINNNNNNNNNKSQITLKSNNSNSNQNKKYYYSKKYIDSDYEYDIPPTKIPQVNSLTNTNIKSNIGKGGFSIVKLAYYNNTPFALKVIDLLNKKFKNSNKNVELIKNEIKINSSLNHPNIVRLYNFFEIDEFYILKLEYMNYGDLKNFIKKFSISKFSETFCGYIITNIIDALVYLRKQSILHRDIKSENIMINEKFEIKLGDFSLSKKIDENNKTFTSRSGTIPYLAPECLKKKIEISSKNIFKTDVFSLGVVMYYLLFNTHPFGYKNNMKITEYSKKIAETEVNFYNENNKNILSNNCINFLKSILEKKLKNRFTIFDCVKHPWFLKIKEITKNICKKCNYNIEKCIQEMQNYEIKDNLFENVSTNVSDVHDEVKKIYLGKKTKRNKIKIFFCEQDNES